MGDSPKVAGLPEKHVVIRAVQSGAGIAQGTVAKTIAQNYVKTGGGALARILQHVVLCAVFMLGAVAANAQALSCPANLGSADLIDHNFSVSFCELCEVGTVRIEIENPFRNNDDADFSDIVIVEDLLASGLTYVPGSTQFTRCWCNAAAGGSSLPSVDANGSVLTWTLGNQFVLPARPNNGGGNQRRLVFEFEVRRHSNVGEEGLVNANRNIDATVTVTPSCDLNFRQSDSTGPGLLPLLEPVPEVIKLGRNLDAGQGPNSYTDTVYGHENDDAIWRIEVINTGTSDLQDLRFDDSMQPGNFEIDYICDDEGDATSAGNGGGTGSCVSVRRCYRSQQRRRRPTVRRRRQSLHRCPRRRQRVLLSRRPPHGFLH